MIAPRKAIRAASYCRMSDVGQEQSIPAQLSAIREYAARNDYQIVREYVDEGISGDDASRAGFGRLIHDARTSHDFDVVLCWDQDRFSRFDTITANFYWYQLREAGVRMVTVNQGEIDFESISGVLLATVNQYSSNEFLKKLSRNVCRGSIHAAKAGKWISRPPYGYCLRSGKLEIHEDKARVVREIFEAVTASDISLAAVCRSLQSRGIERPSGASHWRVNTLRAILANRAYIGDVIYGQQPRGKHNRVLGGQITAIDARGAKKKTRQRLADCIVNADSCPPIVDQATFNDAQRTLAARSRPKRTTQRSYLLSGMVACGHCGKPCHGMKCSYRDRHYVYYGCGGRKDGGAAGLPPACAYLVNATRIESMVVDEILRGPLANESIETFAAAMRRMLDEQRGSVSSRQKKLAATVDRERKAVESLERRLGSAPDDMLDALYGQIRAARERLDAAALELSGDRRLSEMTAGAAAAQVRSLSKWLQSVRETLLSDESEPAARRRALQQVVERVEIFSRAPGRGARKSTKRVLGTLRVTFRSDIFLAAEQFGVPSLG